MVAVAQGEIWWAELPEPVGSEPGFRLPKPSVANAALIVSLDRSVLTHRVGRLAQKPFDQVLHGVDIILGR